MPKRSAPLTAEQAEQLRTLTQMIRLGETSMSGPIAARGELIDQLRGQGVAWKTIADGCGLYHRAVQIAHQRYLARQAAE